MKRIIALVLLVLSLTPLLALVLAGGAGPAGNGLLASAAAALIATLIGTAAGISLQAGFAGRGPVLAFILLPLLLPPVIPGAALLMGVGRLGLGESWPGLVLWHALRGAPVVALIVWAALGRIDPTLFRAAAACGAPPRLAARRIVRPRLVPAILLGGALTFALSAGEGSVAAMLGPEAGGASLLPGLVALVVLAVILLSWARPAVRSAE
jgi:putative spermidine/putrescine transport system permease protein